MKKYKNSFMKRRRTRRRIFKECIASIIIGTMIYGMAHAYHSQNENQIKIRALLEKNRKQTNISTI